MARPKVPTELIILKRVVIAVPIVIAKEEPRGMG